MCKAVIIFFIVQRVRPSWRARQYSCSRRCCCSCACSVVVVVVVVVVGVVVVVVLGLSLGTSHRTFTRQSAWTRCCQMLNAQAMPMHTDAKKTHVCTHAERQCAQAKMKGQGRQELPTPCATMGSKKWLGVRFACPGWSTQCSTPLTMPMFTTPTGSAARPAARQFMGRRITGEKNCTPERAHAGAGAGSKGRGALLHGLGGAHGADKVRVHCRIRVGQSGRALRVAGTQARARAR